jgi:hypothetical protein
VKSACLLTLSAALLFAASADAVPVSLQFSGTITEKTAGPTPDPIDNSYAVGDSFRLFLGYDTLILPDRDPAPGAGLYGDQVSGVFLDYIEWSTSLNEVPFARSLLTTTTIRIQNGAIDEFELHGELLDGGFVTLLLQDLSGKALNSDALPTDLDLSKWDTGTFTQQQPWGTLVEGRVKGLRSVPDGGSAIALLGISLAALSFVRKKRIEHSSSGCV